MQRKTDALIKKSIEYAFSNYPVLNDYVRSHAQEMSEGVMRQHIDLYVNEFSLDLGKTGKDAIQRLVKIHQSLSGTTMEMTKGLFLH